MGVILVTLATLGALTAMALLEGYRLNHPVATAAALLAILLVGAVLLAE
jgi:uncharacterized membrane protein YqjE